MSDNKESQDEKKKNNERESAELERKRQEKDEKDRKERAEEDQRRRDEEAAEEERKRRAAAAESRKRQVDAAKASARAREEAMRQQKKADQQIQNKTEKPKVTQASTSEARAQHAPTAVIFSPEPPKLKQLAHGSIPRPEPDFIKMFKNSLKDEETKKSIIYDHETGQLIFSGEKGLNALVKFLEANPNAKIALVTDRLSKDTLRSLKNHTLNDGTNLLEKLSGIILDGKTIQGHEMRKMIQDKIGPPRPSANSGTESNF